MHFSIEKLIQQNNDILAWYKNAQDLWDDIKKQYDLSDETKIMDLADTLHLKQHTFEHSCGGRSVGQEIMVIVGIAQFYTTQFGFDVGYDAEYDNRFEKALNVYKAFKRSNCSMEVKFHADDVARSYGLEVERQ
jgi:hypothetical protein